VREGGARGTRDGWGVSTREISVVGQSAGIQLNDRVLAGSRLTNAFSKRLWEIADIVVLIEAEEAKIDRKRGPYRKAGEQKERTL
jgi:hypothetical protein